MADDLPVGANGDRVWTFKQNAKLLAITPCGGSERQSDVVDPRRGIKGQRDRGIFVIVGHGANGRFGEFPSMGR